MPKLTIDGQEIEVPPGSTVLQACEAAGREIPVFCYHPRLAIAGNCRMCLVEMEKSPKPIASCAMPVADGMVIKTDTPTVHKARRNVLELLLINHPLDCPICDQGGECDLQDLTLFYGPDHSRFRENKRPVADKYLGPLVSTHMTRCIQCTRCIRFLDEVAGVSELGMVNRGEHEEITTWIEAALTSEMQGNIADICPVGALNHKPYEYRARPWELKKTESVDVLDGVGSNIRVDSKGNEVMRILPRLHEEINEEWLNDKSRYSWDGLRRRRLDVPMVKKGGKLQVSDWREAFAAIRARLDGRKVAFIVGDLVDCETMVMVRELAERLGSPHVDCRQDGAKLQGRVRSEYLFNTTIAGLERADALLLVGTNPRWEAPIVNARIRKRWRQGAFRVARVGTPFDLTYPVQDLGAGAQTLADLLDGGHSFAEVLQGAKNAALILGMGPLARPDGAAVLGLARGVAERFGMVREDWNGFNVLHTAAARVGGLDLALLPGEGGRDVAGILEGAASGEIEVVVLIGADEIDTAPLGNAFVIYQGHHGDRGATVADVVLPGAAYTEKHATYVNTEGRPQRAKLAVFPPGDAKEDWKILRALSEVLGRTIRLDTLAQVRGRMAGLAPHLAAIDQIEHAAWGEFGAGDGTSDKASFGSPVQNFYLTNPISRASAIMRDCVAEILEGGGRERSHVQEATGTHG